MNKSVHPKTFCRVIKAVHREELNQDFEDIHKQERTRHRPNDRATVKARGKIVSGELCVRTLYKNRFFLIIFMFSQI